MSDSQPPTFRDWTYYFKSQVMRRWREVKAPRPSAAGSPSPLVTAPKMVIVSADESDAGEKLESLFSAIGRSELLEASARIDFRNREVAIEAIRNLKPPLVLVLGMEIFDQVIEALSPPRNAEEKPAGRDRLLVDWGGIPRVIGLPHPLSAIAKENWGRLSVQLEVSLRS